MLYIYLPVFLLVVIVAVKLFSFYERDVCLFVLCWLEALADKRSRRRVRGGPTNFLGIRKPRLH